jgi:cell wall-associated NlpC family hydrolase
VVARLLFAALLLASAPALAAPQAMTRDEIQDNAASGVGSSYWWGHGRWNANNGSSPGACSGSCPSCSHCASSSRNGSCNSSLPENGADCSGFVAKV